MMCESTVDNSKTILEKWLVKRGPIEDVLKEIYAPKSYQMGKPQDGTNTTLGTWLEQGVSLQVARHMEDHKQHLCHKNEVRNDLGWVKIPWFKRFRNVLRANYKLANLGDIDFPALKKMKRARCAVEVCELADEHKETYFTDELHEWHDMIQKSIRGEEDSDEDSDGYESDESNISMITSPGEKRKRPRRSIRIAEIEWQRRGPLHRVHRVHSVGH